MARGLMLLFLILVWAVVGLGCAKSGATAEEKKAALQVAMDTAKSDEAVGPNIIEMREAHGKMVVIIKPGVHPQSQSDFIQKVGVAWFQAYPEGKKPTKNDMVQVWLYETDESKDDLGMVQLWTDQYGEMQMNFHHYKTQPIL